MYVYDIETFPNVFTCTIKRPSDGARWVFEISNRINQGVQLFSLLTAIRDSKGRMVGYNNIAFDYPVIHLLIERGGHISAYELYTKAFSIINSNDRFSHMVWESDNYVAQIDLFKIHHFDNMARSTSLKMLEFNMRSNNIQDLPFEPNTELTDEQIPTLLTYNEHDVDETIKFLEHSLPMIEFRDGLTAKHGINFVNHNDGKIGSAYFIMELERLGVECYHRPHGRKEPRQTHRPQIALNDVILPWINFNNPEFQRVLDWLRAQTITETNGVFKNLNCIIDGFQYDFGTGGIHGSIASQIVSSDDTHQIIDLDVASYYPNLAITNKFYPEHLGEAFCDIYLDIYNQRRGFKKGTMENASLKYALNVPYGQSNSIYSPFYDPAYTMAITINGQLLLCLLAEYLATIAGLTMIQINTDGLTVKCPRDQIDTLMFIAQTWEQVTGLVLERADYSRMMIRDVNGYIGEYESGKLKNKGPYVHKTRLSEGDKWHPDYCMDWNQNHSSPIVAIAAEAALVRGVPVEQTIMNHTDKMDFMLRTKVPRSSRLMWGDQQVQNITRYYVSFNGAALVKVMPPTPAQLKKNPDAPDRRIGINVGWTVEPCNNLTERDDTEALNYDFYIAEARKIVEPLINGV